MFQVAFGDPDKSDSYSRKKKEEGRSKKEEAIDRIEKVQLRTSSRSERLLF
jgi:hypothetical protein